MTVPRPALLAFLFVSGAGTLYYVIQYRRGKVVDQRWFFAGLFVIALGLVAPGDGVVGIAIGLVGIALTGYGIWVRQASKPRP